MSLVRMNVDRAKRDTIECALCQANYIFTDLVAKLTLVQTRCRE